MSVAANVPSIRSLLGHGNGRVRILEAHDDESIDVVRNARSRAGDAFHGVWMSGLTQSTCFGLPDTELISPLERSYTMAGLVNACTIPGKRPMCAAFDADSGGKMEDIPALVSSLVSKGVSMIIIEDKRVAKPGEKVNSLSEASDSQSLADKHDFAKAVHAFRKAGQGKDVMITARIESFTVRRQESDPEADALSQQHALRDALERAHVYCQAGADTIMIHSKSKAPDEVFDFIRRFKEQHANIPVVLVPTTYAETHEQDMFAAGANVIIYANHLMRAKIRAIEASAQQILQGLEGHDAAVGACLKARNYGCMLRLLQLRDYGFKAKRTAFLIERCAAKNMDAVANMLLEGKTAGAADSRMITVKQLLQINGFQVVAAEPFMINQPSAATMTESDIRPFAQF